MIPRRKSEASSPTETGRSKHVNKRSSSPESGITEGGVSIQKRGRQSQEGRRKSADNSVDDSVASDVRVVVPVKRSCHETSKANLPLQISYFSDYSSSPAPSIAELSNVPSRHQAVSASVHSSNGAFVPIQQHDMDLIRLLRLSTAQIPSNPTLSTFGDGFPLQPTLNLMSSLQSSAATYPFAMENSTSPFASLPHPQAGSYDIIPTTIPQLHARSFDRQESLRSLNLVGANPFSFEPTTTIQGLDAANFLSQLRLIELSEKYRLQFQPSEQQCLATALSRHNLDVLTMNSYNNVQMDSQRILVNSFPTVAVASLDDSQDVTHIDEAKSRFVQERATARSSNQDDTSGLGGISLACPGDRGMLNDHLVFLRQQIEYFRATPDDILSYTRGRNRGIAMHQIGIRCRHCSHIPVDGRRKGSTYFPSNLMGIYQAAQNISAEHLQSGLCSEMSPDIQSILLKTKATRTANSGAGKAYWADSARSLGLIDTEDGIRFAADVRHSMALPTRSGVF